MGEKNEVKAVKFLRRIRDKQTRQLSRKTEEEILAFFCKAGESARRLMSKRQTLGRVRRASNTRLQLTGRRSSARKRGQQHSRPPRS